MALGSASKLSLVCIAIEGINCEQGEMRGEFATSVFATASLLGELEQSELVVFVLLLEMSQHFFVN